MDDTTIRQLMTRDVERLEVNLALWRPARIAESRATADVELLIRGELMALKWSLYTPAPLGTVEDVLEEGLAKVLDSQLARG
jgi:hypothetical protein